MFELHVNNPDATNGSIPISWCIDKELLQRLASTDVVDPQIVIVVAPVTGYSISKEYRHIVPLKDLMAYVQLHCVGENRIFAFITYLDKKSAKDRFLSKSSGQYCEDILNSEGSGFLNYIFGTALFTGNNNSNRAEPIVVDVPAGCFAPPPSEFEKKWVNHLFHDKVVDQCQFRKRRIFAYTLQPFVILALMIPSFVAIIVALAIADKGIWNVIKTAFSPLTTAPLIDAFGALEGSIFYRRWECDTKELEATTGPGFAFWKWLGKKVGLCVFCPVVLGVVFLLLNLSHGLAALGIVALCLVLIVSFFCLIGFFAKGGSLFGFFNMLFESTDKELWYLNADEEQLILCSGEPKVVNVNALPKNHRTLKLRFQQLKSQVCKPFSR